MGIYSRALGASVIALVFGSIEGANAATSSDGLEEIVVTAQRRAESAQSVPIAVAAFSEDQMNKLGVVSPTDLASVVPGLSINPSGARSPMFLRGVGNNGTSTSPSVLLFVDGVYQPFDATGTDFNNVQSIELAKGPQGTLFGRNATGGVIQVTTKNPFDWQGLDVQAGYGNYETFTSKVYGSAKLSEKVAADIAAFYEDQAEGWGTNVFDGSEYYQSKRWGIRNKWVAKVTDDFKATLSMDYAYRRGQQGVGISAPVSGEPLFNQLTAQPYTLPTPYDVLSDFPSFYRTKEGGAALTLEKEFGDIKLLSISAYRRSDERLRIDFDGSQFPLAALSRDDHRRSITQEVQLSGGGSKFNWVAGLYYFNLKNTINGPSIAGFGAALPVAAGGFGTFGPPYSLLSLDQNDAYAAYGQATAEVLPDTRLTLGARYTIETRKLRGATFNSIDPDPANPFVTSLTAGTADTTFYRPNFRVALDHNFTPDVLGYFSYSHGFNAGFFNQIAFTGFTEAPNAFGLSNPVVRPEGIDAYEVGFKTDWLDRRLRVNVSAFLYDYTNLQQQVFGLGGISSVNAAAAQIRGVDLDIVARPIRDLTLSVSGNYLDSHYDSYLEAPNYVFLPTGQFTAVGPADAAGKELVQAPRYGAQATATYTLHTGVGTFDTSASVNYQSKQFADPLNKFAIPGRTLVNLTEQWTSNDERTYITLWVKNLTDQEYDLSYSLLDHVGFSSNPGAPRTYGIIVGHKF